MSYRKVNSQSNVEILPTFALFHVSGWKVYFSINFFVSSESKDENSSTHVYLEKESRK